MRSKKLLAFALAFSMAFAGAVPAGAASSDVEAAGQQLQAEEGIDENQELPQEEPMESVSEGDVEEEIVDDEDSLIQEEPAVSADETVVPPEEPLEAADVSEDQAFVSENEVSGNGYVVNEPEWVLADSQYKLRKQGSEEFYTEDDGLISVKGTDGKYAYYAFDKQGNMRTGRQDLSVGMAKPGVYYFIAAGDEECKGIQQPAPGNSRIGQLIEQEGWRYVSKEASGDGNDKWLYLQTGGMWDSSKINMQKVSDQKTYFLDKTGSLQKDVQKTVDGSIYYFDSDGAMITNSFKNIKNNQYYFGADGKRFEETGWQRLNGNFYYFHKNHYRVIRTKWWQITENGVKGSYYFSDTGEMYKKRFVIENGFRYYVNNKGRMVTGLQLVNGKRYYFRPKAEGKNPVGSAYKGWVKLSNRWYYFKSNCQAAANELVTISGKYYYFNKLGKMFKGGWTEINGKLYFFKKQTSKNRNGYAITKEWKKKSGKWYYASAKGNMLADKWLTQKGKTYYFNKNSVMVTNKWKQYKGEWGYLNSKGVFSQKWIKISGKWKYAKTNGSFAKGWTYITQNGTRYKYYFNNKGYLVQDLRGQVSGPYMLKVDRKRNQVTAYAKDTDGKYIVPIVAMPCSVGLPATPTPTGTYTATRGGRWQSLMGPSWGQYGMLVVASIGIYFHSVPGENPDPYSVPAGEWNLLGRSAASHGCIRLAVIDAKWIYENCNGATVEIADYANAGPFDHKTYTPITSAYNWDPTDPTAKGYL